MGVPFKPDVWSIRKNRKGGRRFYVGKKTYILGCQGQSWFYAHFPGVDIIRTTFYSQNYLGLEDKLYSYARLSQCSTANQLQIKSSDLSVSVQCSFFPEL